VEEEQQPKPAGRSARFGQGLLDVDLLKQPKNAFQNHPSRDRRQMSEQASEVKA
jgi:hypothetical protein